MLARGRGNGFRQALRAGPSVATAVLACVLDDPRWDRQIEMREDYYARLLLELNADITPMGERLLCEDNKADESDFWLPVGVLAQLARRGHLTAMQALAQAVREGRRWRSCLDALQAAGGQALIESVVQAQDILRLMQSID